MPAIAPLCSYQDISLPHPHSRIYAKSSRFLIILFLFLGTIKIEKPLASDEKIVQTKFERKTDKFQVYGENQSKEVSKSSYD